MSAPSGFMGGLSGLTGASGATGAHSHQSDTSLWLHNKLGTSNDSWTGGSIVSQLNPDILLKIEHCFCDLQPQVKLKLLLSLFHIPRRNLEMWKPQIDAILQVAQEDSEPWVAMLAELLKTYPASGQLNSDIRVPDTNRKLFTDLLTELKKVLKKSDQSDTVLPIECHFLNKNAFISLVGHQPQTTKHFALKRKPKAAALKAELLNKSQEAATKVKSSSSGSFPIRKSTMPRKMSEAGPLKGLPSRVLGSLGGFKSQRSTVQPRNNRKPEGGVKILNFNEQPIGFAAAKKRKRQQELEEQQAKKAQALEEKETAAKAAAAVKATPDYAAGLSTLNPPTPAPASVPSAPTPAYAPPTPLQPPAATPSYAPQPSSLPTQPTVAVQPSLPTVPVTTGLPSSIPSQISGFSNSLLASQQPIPQLSQAASQGSQPPTAASLAPPSILRTPTTNTFPANLTSLEPLPPSAVSNGANSQLQQQPPPPYQSLQTTLQTASPQHRLAPGTTPGSARIVQLPTHPIPQTQTQPRFATTQMLGQRTAGPPVSVLTSAVLGQHPQTLPGSQPQTRIIRTVRPILSTLQPQPPTILQQPQPIQPAQVQPTPPAPPQPQRRSLTLTKDQMMEAQEMFRTANKVTRPEKALILGFMAGSRDNPCPHLGNVVTIKLSENQENIPQGNLIVGMIVETHFQMNYSTGEWKRIKKYRRLEEVQ
eukprot:maker-scaffold755_size101758-snap-gene-0.26 protein:Tk12407 transcript:maker-scaffold755_size101758-snap-gene-0.26-mRNA-1 annotation:"negative elongation factor"